MTGRAQLFHGTVSDIVGTVRPVGRGAGSVHGSQGYRWKQRADEHAFATESEHEAWQYADMATHGPRKPGSLGSNDAPKGRARVYTVAPAADQEMGAYHPDHPARARGKGPGERWSEHVSKTGFPVTGRIDTKPGHQGTFPMDWTAHRKAGSHADVNHPGEEATFHGGHTPGSTAFNDSAMNFMARGPSQAHTRYYADELREHTRQVPGQLELHLGAQFRA